MVPSVRRSVLVAGSGVLLSVWAGAGGARAQVPTGAWRYEGVTEVSADGNARQVGVEGYLRLHANGTHSHGRRVGSGGWAQAGGSYRTRGAWLYLPHLSESTGRAMELELFRRDTFYVREMGGRLLLSQLGAVRREYALVRDGAPAPRSRPRTEAEPLVPGVGARADSLRFFVAGPGAPTLPNRRYAARFRADSTYAVGMELVLAHPMARQQASVPVACQVLDPAGTVSRGAEWNMVFGAGTIGTRTSAAWIPDPMGTTRLAPGTYRVACAAELVIVARGSFEIL